MCKKAWKQISRCLPRAQFEFVVRKRGDIFVRERKMITGQGKKKFEGEMKNVKEREKKKNEWKVEGRSRKR